MTDIDRLSTACLALARGTLAALPPDLAARLKHSHKLVRHPNHGSWMFEFWDRHQNALLPKSHFKYCVVYDPTHRNHPRHDGYFHAWLNTIRIYRDRITIEDRLRHDIQALPLRGFKVGLNPRAISAGTEFTWPVPSTSLGSEIGAGLSRLIRTIHPVIIPIIDRLTGSAAPDTSRAPHPASGTAPHRPAPRDTTRSIPAAWRRDILTHQRHRCALCGADLRRTGHHIDHIVPFSRGGGSDLANLQALCPDCNLRKGAQQPRT